MPDSILGSVIGGLIVAGLATIWARLYRARLFARLRGIREIFGEVLATYPDAPRARAEIEREAAKSTCIKYIGDFNTTLIAERDPSETLLHKILQRRRLHELETQVQFLHLSPKSGFLEIRARELNRPPRYIQDELLAAFRSLRTIATGLHLPKDVVQVRHYNFQVVFRVILLDQCAFIGFYRAGRMGGGSPMIKVSRDGELYQAVSRYFDVLWTHLSHPAEEDFPDVETEEAQYRTVGSG